MFCLASSNCSTKLYHQYNFSDFFYRCLLCYILLDLHTILWWHSDSFLSYFNSVFQVFIIDFNEYKVPDGCLKCYDQYLFFSIFIRSGTMALMLSLRNSLEFFFSLEKIQGFTFSHLLSRQCWFYWLVLIYSPQYIHHLIYSIRSIITGMP